MNNHCNSKKLIKRKKRANKANRDHQTMLENRFIWASNERLERGYRLSQIRRLAEIIDSPNIPRIIATRTLEYPNRNPDPDSLGMIIKTNRVSRPSRRMALINQPNRLDSCMENVVFGISVFIGREFANEFNCNAKAQRCEAGKEIISSHIFEEARRDKLSNFIKGLLILIIFSQKSLRFLHDLLLEKRK